MLRAALPHRRSSEIYASIFSVDLSPSNDAAYDRVADAGLKWVRSTIEWKTAEDEGGQGRFDAHDRLVDGMRERGLSVLLVLSPIRPGDTESTSGREAQEAFVAHARDVAAHFAGRVWCYEFPLWDGSEATGARRAPERESYRLLAKAVHDGIREADPDAVLVAGVVVDGGVPVDEELLQSVDGISIHVRAQGPPETEPWRADVRRLAEAFRERSGRRLRVLKTRHRWKDASPRTRAKYLARTCLLDMAGGLRLSNWDLSEPRGTGIGDDEAGRRQEVDVMRNITSLFDDTLWYRRDLGCTCSIDEGDVADHFRGYVYMKEGSDDHYTVWVPFWLGVESSDAFEGVPADVIVDVLNVDDPAPRDAVVLDLLDGSERPIEHGILDGRIVFENLVVEDYPKVIVFEAAMVRGYPKGEKPKTVEDKVRTARTIRRIQQQIASWSEPAEGQVIAQPSVIRPIVSQGGYHPLGTKSAVVWTNRLVLSGTFEVVDQTMNRQYPATQAVVYRGDLEDAGEHIWGGRNLVADFSDLTRPGFYRLRVRFDQDMRETTESYGFTIRPSLYLDLAEHAAGFLYYQRCGTRIPGWHEACHVDDAVILPDGRRIDAGGGWHSAGDYNKWIGPAHFAVRGLCTLFEGFADRFAEDRRGGIPKLIDEAWWEVSFLKKVYYEGTFLSIVSRGVDPWIWSGAPERAPPRIATLEQIEAIHQRSNSVTTLFTMAAMVRTARLLANYREHVDREVMEIARDCYATVGNRDPNAKTELGPFGVGMRDDFLMFHAGMLALDLELYAIEKDERYRLDARKRVRAILSQRGEDGHFYSDEARESKLPNVGLHLVALYEYLELEPRAPCRDEIVDAFASWISYIEPLTDLSPFGQVGGYTPEGRTSNIPGRCSVISRNAWALATASLLLGKPEYAQRAERQLQWIVGLNPADVSMMVGVGKGPGCYHNRYSFVEGHEDGMVPGAIVNGIRAGTGELFDLGDYDTRNFVIVDRLPVDYPVVDTGVHGWTYAYHVGETRNFTNGWFMMAAAQVARALRMQER